MNKPIDKEREWLTDRKTDMNRAEDEQIDRHEQGERRTH